MSFSPEAVAEMNVLLLFTPSTHLKGIKIHHTADPALVAAAQRLHEQGFITQADGGYLTDLGTRASEHAHTLFTMLNAETESLSASHVG
ncbi:MAG: TIGR02647 family protein [Gammaproteobacteria bacterium]|jgi:uncharacterized protein (TIGR02647 family)|nr:TIGR02647 family protein [Gammaproteobacteria bacterium]HEX5636918.1 TIGR02647 family protein [Gammaproteobacteria bacterium]